MGRTIIIVKNYTGDVLNFGLAKEHYSATHPDKAGSVRFIVVGDDVAVGRTQGHIVGRRGLAGVPGTSVQDNHLRADEIEIGLGIHNESGNSRISPIPALNKLVPDLLQLITSTTDPERAFVPFENDGKDEVVLLVNNLGGLSELELGAIVSETKQALDHQHINVRRVLAGTFMTSLNMPGFSLTLLLLPRPNDRNAPSIDLLLALLDDPTNAPGWRWSSKSEPTHTLRIPESLTASTPSASSQAANLRASNVTTFNTSIENSCRALIAAEPEITKMDSIAGDGDCGLTLKDGANGSPAHTPTRQAFSRALEEGKVTGEDVIGSMIAISKVAEEAMGGTSGALYSIFFSALAQGLAGTSTIATPDVWSSALNSALDRLYTYTRARPPSRTLVDPLAAFIEAFPSGLEVAVKAATEAAEKTRDLEAKAGRSAYVEGGRLRAERVPDPELDSNLTLRARYEILFSSDCLMFQQRTKDW
ncbi:dihydroxyacetone kinase [Pisolithus marmoratus]|nr:dihydroxyacetone kinase [Pisolithus marmoratus]